MPTQKLPTKRASKFSIWLNRQLESAGRSQLEIAKEAGFRAEDLTKWKKGQAIPEMDNLLKLAHYFKEDPEKLFHIAGKPELMSAYRLFLPKYEEKELSEKDLYPNKGHVELHQRFQILLAKGAEKEVEEQIQKLETSDSSYFRLREAVELCQASAGFLIREGLRASPEYWHGLRFDEVDPDLPTKREKGWVIFRGSASPEPQTFYLCLKEPKRKIDKEVKDRIRICMVDWVSSFAAKGFPKDHYEIFTQIERVR